MKKYFFSALAAVAMLNLTSCLSEEEVNLTKGEMGHISLNISADNDLSTRAVQTVADNTAWFAFIDGASTDFGTADTHRTIAELATFDFPYGTYTVTASNYANLDAALSGKGNAYYEGVQVTSEGNELANVSVTAGATTQVYVSCGKAKNARLAIVNAGFSGTINSVSAACKLSDNTTDRTVSFATADVANTEDASAKAFFRAGETVTFTFNYNIGTFTNKTASIPMEMGGAGTRNVLSIKSDANGNIQLMTIQYDDAFDEGNVNETITISAETGERI